MKLIDPQPMETLPESGNVFIQIGTAWAWRDPIDVNEARELVKLNHKMVQYWSYHAIDASGLVRVTGPAGSGGSGVEVDTLSAEQESGLQSLIEEQDKQLGLNRANNPIEYEEGPPTKVFPMFIRKATTKGGEE